MDEELGDTTLFFLPYPQLIPGDRFREPYYWDSAFCFECLLTFHQHEKRAMAILYNFEEVIKYYGFVPNGFRTYYLTRSQPPMLARMSRAFREHNDQWIQSYGGYNLPLLREKSLDMGIRLIEPEDENPDDEFIFLPMLQKEYAYWMRGESQCGDNAAIAHVVKQGTSVLNRYYDESDRPRPESYAEDIKTAKEAGDLQPGRLFRNLRAAAESGWDFSSRWLGDYKTLSTIRTTKILPVDLNALLHSLEMELTILHAEKGPLAAFEHYDQKARERKDAINKFHWNEEKGFFYDYDWEKGEQTPVESLAAVFPLLCEIASDHQAELVRQKLERDFLKEGGLVATLTEGTGQQWDYPNAWAPLQFAAVEGLLAYAKTREYSDPFFNLAFRIAARFHKCAREFFTANGLMMEKYNAVDPKRPGEGGEYKPQTGFGWTNAVVLYFERFLKRHTSEPKPIEDDEFDLPF